MQLGQVRLTRAQREHWFRSGTCLYCSDTSQHLAQCLIWPKDCHLAIEVGKLLRRPSFPSPTRAHLELQVSISDCGGSWSLCALVDPGAEDNFMDAGLSAVAGISLHPLTGW